MNEQEQSVVAIDENTLDKECIKLPTDYLKYAHKSANAKRDVDELKAELDVIQAELSKKIRDEPTVYGLEKVTESAISTTVITLPAYKAKLKELQDARHEADLAQAVVWALEHKKRTLTLLVELHGMGYFANPKISERGREAVDDMTKRARPGNIRRHREDD